MKICVDAREFTEKGRTGISRYLENLLSPLITDPDLRFVLFVNDPAFVPTTLLASSMKLIRLPTGPTLFIDQIVLPFLSRKERADVFFSPYYKVPLSGRFKRIITVHDIMFLRLQGLDAPSSIRKWFAHRQLRLAANRADMVLVDSDFTGRDLSDLLPNVSDKVRTLYPDLATEWFKPATAETANDAKRKFANGHPFFLYVGNFKPHKNVDLLISAFAGLQRDGPIADRRLLLVGGDPENAGRIASLISDLGMDKLVHAHRNVPDTELRALYAAADWFVTPSIYEGFGYPAVEAMASGCPVIYHPCTSLTEVVGDVGVAISEPSSAGVIRALQAALAVGVDERAALIGRGNLHAGDFAYGSAAGAFRAALETLNHGG